jgi:hypothetical protein
MVVQYFHTAPRARLRDYGSVLGYLCLIQSVTLLCSVYLHADDIRASSDLIVTRVNKEKFTLDIVGTATAVRNAKFMLPTQVSTLLLCLIGLILLGLWCVMTVCRQGSLLRMYYPAAHFRVCFVCTALLLYFQRQCASPPIPVIYCAEFCVNWCVDGVRGQADQHRSQRAPGPREALRSAQTGETNPYPWAMMRACGDAIGVCWANRYQ